MSKFFIEAENESGEERIAETVDALNWEDAVNELRNRGRAKWPGTAWRVVTVGEWRVVGNSNGDSDELKEESGRYKLAYQEEAIKGDAMRSELAEMKKGRALDAVFTQLDLRASVMVADGKWHQATALAILDHFAAIGRVAFPGLELLPDKTKIAEGLPDALFPTRSNVEQTVEQTAKIGVLPTGAHPNGLQTALEFVERICVEARRDARRSRDGATVDMLFTWAQSYLGRAWE